MPIIGLSQNMLTDRIATVGRAAYGRLNPRELSARAAVSVPMTPLLPLIIAGSAMLYHQGNEATKPNGGDKNAWWHMVVEAGLSSWILKYTTGIYPLFGLGLAAYRSGQKHTAHEKIQAMVNTGVGMLMGWAGVHLFESFAEAGRANDDHIIHNALLGKGKNEARFKEWMDNHLEKLAQSDEKAKSLKESLVDLRKALTEKKALYSKTGQYQGRPDWEVVEPLSEKLLNLKSQVTERVAEIGNQLFTGLDREHKSIVNAALGKIEESQSSFSRLNRAMNPIYGYIIVGLMLGAPIARWISSKIGDSRPQLKSWKPPNTLFAQEHRIITKDTYGFASSHGPGHGASHYMSGAPTISWPGVIGDKHSH